VFVEKLVSVTFDAAVSYGPPIPPVPLLAVNEALRVEQNDMVTFRMELDSEVGYSLNCGAQKRGFVALRLDNIPGIIILSSFLFYAFCFYFFI
jgi:hypothetical protein